MAEVAAPLRRASPLARHKTVSLTILPAMARLAARGGPEAAGRLGRAFGVELSQQAMRANVVGERAALWLGPDEWLLLAPPDETLARAIEAGLGGEPGCIVDISHRQLGLAVTGPGAALALNAGCPLDLDDAAFPIATCTRTVLAKADIVLWRPEPDTFHLECWRSFAPYCLDFLRQAAADCAT